MLSPLRALGVLVFLTFFSVAPVVPLAALSLSLLERVPVEPQTPVRAFLSQSGWPAAVSIAVQAICSVAIPVMIAWIKWRPGPKRLLDGKGAFAVAAIGAGINVFMLAFVGLGVYWHFWPLKS